METHLSHQPIILKDWILSTALTFLLCQTFCLLTSLDGTVESPWWAELMFDLAYCALFSLTTILIGKMVWRIHPAPHFTYPDQMLRCVVTLFLNIVLAYAFEHLYALLFPSPDRSSLQASTLLFCVVATMVALLRTMLRYCRLSIEQSQAIVQLQQQSLRLQMDPHFIFNSLSTLAELTRANPARAENYVIQLSHVYRYILSHIHHNQVPLSESISIIREYVSLQQMRVGGNIRLQLQPHLSQACLQLPPMALQLVVENAVKHNTPAQGQQLDIEISLIHTTVVVRNSLGATPSAAPSTGMGWQCLLQAYRLLGLPAPTRAIIDGHYEVHIPTSPTANTTA